MNSKILQYTITLFWAVLLSVTVCCGHRGRAWSEMNRAEAVMDSLPDSALNILDGIDPEILKGAEERARYALLKSMALDKNYIDTTDFSILQPAIDYYLKKGTPDEKLKTYYYQGRIYQNRQSLDTAMICFLYGEDCFELATDTLLMANLLVAKGTLLYSIYKIDDFIKANIEAANLYKTINRTDFEVLSWANVLDGSFINHDKKLADSIISVVSESVSDNPELASVIAPYRLIYRMEFGDKRDVEDGIRKIYLQKNQIEDSDKLDIAAAYLKIGDFRNAKRFLDSIDPISETATTLKYLAVKPDILENTGDTKGALADLKKYFSIIDTINEQISDHDLQFAEKRHDLEKSHLLELQRRDRQNIIIFCSALFLLVLAGLIIRIVMSQNKILKLKDLNLKKENRNLELAKRNVLLENERAQLEIENQAKTIENRRLKIEQLEEEKETLKELLEKNRNLSKPIEEIIKKRNEMLNKMFAYRITSEESYARPYEDWINTLLKDKEEFMNSTMLAFRVSNPKFIKYLEVHDLTESEIKYVCLYAIGLSGKEVGKYIGRNGHYNISAEVRKKLDMGDEKTSLKVFIRNLLG